MSNQDVTTHKFVAVLSKKVEPGKAMNALAHMVVGLVATATKEEIDLMGLVDYADKDGGAHVLSKNSFVILRADNGNQIRSACGMAKEKGVHFSDFAHTMHENTFIEQVERTRQTPETELEYFGIVLFGPIPVVSEITRKFSIWK